jgi:hypothetical protein
MLPYVVVWVLHRRVIKCWDLAFATMAVGERAVLTCAPDYAYGNVGSAPKIPAGATLRFDVELVSGTPAPVAAPQPGQASEVVADEQAVQVEL